MKTGKLLIICQLSILLPVMAFAQDSERHKILKKSFPDSPGNFVSFFDASSKEYFTISGHFEDYEGKPEFFRMWDYGLLTDEMTTRNINSSGDFTVTFPIYYSHEITLSIGRMSYVLIAHPNNKIHLEFDKDGNLEFFGDGAMDARILHSYSKQVKTKYRQTPPWDRDDLITIDPMAYREIVEDRRKFWISEHNAYFDSLESEKKDYSSFIKRNRLLDIEVDYLGQINSFEPSRKYKNSGKAGLKKVPGDFYEDLSVQDIKLEESDYTYEDLEVLLEKAIYAGYLDQIKIKVSKTAIAKKILEKARSEVTSLEYEWLFGHFYGYRGEVRFNDEMISEFLEVSNSDWLKREINAIQGGKVEEGEIRLVQGTDTTDASHMNFDELMSLVTSKHIGKTIYLDIWGTWCTNCIYQFDFSKLLQQKVDLDKVAFVYFAVRSDKNLWLKRIEKSNLIGDHYFLSDDQYNKMAKRWKSLGLPQYVIINRNGEVIDIDAPSPSNEFNKLDEDLVILLSAK